MAEKWDGRERREVDKVLSEIKELNLRTAIEIKYLGDRIEQVHKRAKESDEAITSKISELAIQINGDGNGNPGMRLKIRDLEIMHKDLRAHMLDDSKQLKKIQTIIWAATGIIAFISFLTPILLKVYF